MDLLKLILAAMAVAFGIALISAPLKLWSIASDLKAIRKLLEDKIGKP